MGEGQKEEEEGGRAESGDGLIYLYVYPLCILHSPCSKGDSLALSPPKTLGEFL